MKKLLAVLAVLAMVGATSKTFAAAGDPGTVLLNNYDVNSGAGAPIFYIDTATRLPQVGSLVDVLGGPPGGTLQALSIGGVNQFPLSEPGMFDAGFAVVPGTTQGGQGTFQVRAWRGAPGSSFATASEFGSTAQFTQAVGTNPDLPNLPVPTVLQTSSFTVGIVPEPSTVLLGLLGAGALLIRRRK